MMVATQANAHHNQERTPPVILVEPGNRAGGWFGSRS
jgi:hypothetical protein